MYTTVEKVKKECGMSDNQYIGDDIYTQKIVASDNKINGALAGCGYTLPLEVDDAAYTPGVIEEISRLFSASSLLLTEFLGAANNSAEDAKEKKKEASDLLKQIVDGVIKLVDDDGNLLPQTSRVSGYPDDTTATAGPDGITPEPAKFTAGMKL